VNTVVLKIINKTSYSNDFILKLIQFAKPQQVGNNFKISVKYGKKFTGFCFRHFNRINISILKGANYPQVRNHDRKGYVNDIMINSEIEYLIFLLSHEFMHLARMNKSERECDAYGIRNMERWRR